MAPDGARPVADALPSCQRTPRAGLVSLCRAVCQRAFYQASQSTAPAPVRVQQKNGAYIHHSDDKQHYTRIKL